MTGVIRAAPRSWTAAASATGRTRPRRRSSRPGPPPSFYPGPGLLLPHLDGAVVPLDGPARPHLARPAAAAQQVPDPGDGVPHPEPPGHQVTDPGQRPPLVIESGGQRPGLQHRLQPASCCSSSRHRAAGPFDASPARPLASHACRQRRTDRSVTCSSAAISAAGTRCSNLSTAASWTCSRRLRPSAVKPPPCGGPHTSCIPPETHPSAPRTSRIKELQPARPRRA
jgi:hypothetical protein